MKNKKISVILSVIIIVILGSIYYTSVGFTKPVPNTAKVILLADSTTPVYTCPMHPEVTSDKPGQCPKCGMDLVLKEDKSKDKSMNMNGCMDKCKEMGCNMENCKGESGACKDCKEDCKNMMKSDGKKMDEKKMDKDCKMGNDKDCKSKCMGK